MGLFGNGHCDDRGGYPELCRCAVAGDDIRHHAEMAARRRLEWWGAEVHDTADGGVISGVYCQYRAYYPWLDD
ncbi:hypothetical protein D3C86_1885710 [compost metagenome]